MLAQEVDPLILFKMLVSQQLFNFSALGESLPLAVEELEFPRQ